MLASCFKEEEQWKQHSKIPVKRTPFLQNPVSYLHGNPIHKHFACNGNFRSCRPSHLHRNTPIRCTLCWMNLVELKRVLIAVASLIGIAPQHSPLRAALQSIDGQRPCRVLCIGLGGGTLPLFLMHHYPGMLVDVVELDPTVIKAASTMGFAQCR